MNRDTRPPGIRYRNHHLRWSETDMDDIRGSFSRFKKDIKHRFRGRKGEVAANTSRERADPSASPLRSDSRLLASGHGGEGTRTSTDALQVRSWDRSPQPEPIPARENHGDDSQKREAEVDENEASARGHPGPEPEIKIAVGGGPDQGAHPPLSPPSLPHEAELESG